MYCRHCGAQLEDDSRFCISCGTAVDGSVNPALKEQAGGTDYYEAAKNAAASINKKFSELTGDDGTKRLKLSDLFTNVFARHTREDRENIFICGTSKTTPYIGQLTVGWQKPWLYSRVFMIFLLAFLVLWFCADTLQNITCYPGVIIMGSFAGPIAVLFMLFELNVPRNVSFYHTLSIFLVGGCFSLLVTLIIYEITGAGSLTTFWGALLVGFVEELGKFIIVLIVIARMKDCRFVLTGILVGAAIGAGFAAFESAGYSFIYILYGGLSKGVETIFLRGILSPGGHVAWAAMEGAAIMLAKGDSRFTFSMLKNVKVIVLFVIAVLLHAIWDAPFWTSGAEMYLKAGILIILAWVVILRLIRGGLTQIERVERGGSFL